MNRPIKFRAYSELFKKMFYPGDGTTNVIIFHYKKSGQLEGFMVGKEDYSWYVLGAKSMYEDTPVYLMQFTGIFDKNGTEIYEGDILKNSHCKHGVVKFGEYERANYPHGDYLHGFYVEFKNACFCVSDCDINIVIGNIHENPELTQ